MKKSSLPPELLAASHKESGPSTADPRIIRLSQESNLREIERIEADEWITLYLYDGQGGGSKCFYSAFLKSSRVQKAMTDDAWETMIGNGLPGFSQSYENGTSVTKYDRFGFAEVEPVVFVRQFHGLKPRQFDINEEFRHFHNLYHDRKNDRYISIDERGEDNVVLEVSSSLVRVKARYIKQFMAAKQIYLAIYFDHRVDASIDIANANSYLPAKRFVRKLLRYSFNVGDLSTGETFSRILGKTIISLPPIERSGVWPYENSESQFVDLLLVWMQTDPT